MVFFEFGYDSRLDDYQIVKGVHSGSAEAVKMEVFSLKGNTWRTIQVIAPTTVSRLEPTSLNNGVLHWLSKVNDPCKKSVIVSVDLAEDKFLEMTPVPDYIPKDTRIYIKVLGDCLYVYAIDTVYWEAWIVEGSGTKASWTRLFKYCSNPTVFVWTECSLQILWVSKNGNILLNTDGWELVLYNPKEQTLKQYRVPNDGDDGFLATAYMETLVSPNAPDGSIIE
ncbi:hypothetical protein JCGZ_13607 [Jatropha curcas]|uniref:F-box associated beta-propeller type 3 domain-containing protein n=2 Tax=Jatropha curcas TaxID=180498 RepID=A0A067KLC5_JATCU|nr:hypothetical protein JCGZ_13607 [Jatropha curcas]